MVIELKSKLTLEEQLASAILRSGFTPQTTDISSIVKNIILTYEYDLKENGQDYYTMQNDPVSDILKYAKDEGGYITFDFVPPEADASHFSQN